MEISAVNPTPDSWPTTIASGATARGGTSRRPAAPCHGNHFTRHTCFKPVLGAVSAVFSAIAIQAPRERAALHHLALGAKVSFCISALSTVMCIQFLCHFKVLTADHTGGQVCCAAAAGRRVPSCVSIAPQSTIYSSLFLNVSLGGLGCQFWRLVSDAASE